MKKSVLFLCMIISSVVLAQSPKPQKIKYSTLNQKICLNQKGFQLVLKSISTDSRCPEGVTCMWEGEVSGVVSVYKDSKLIENRIMVFSLKYEKENKEWFSKYLPEKQRNIKSIGVLPYPKEGHTINPEAYYLKIGYLK